MRRQVINETQLRNLVANMIMEELEAQQLDEGWFGDKWNQARSGASTFFQRNSGKTPQDRWQNTKQNWSNQGDINRFRNLKKDVVDFMNFLQNSGGRLRLNYQSTIGELIGSLETMTGARSSQIGRTGGNAYNTKTQGFRQQA